MGVQWMGGSGCGCGHGAGHGYEDGHHRWGLGCGIWDVGQLTAGDGGPPANYNAK